MSYQALLFCPDEKTARVVTQVLTELDFMVEPCNEPFAAVKKLMAQHFDAVVVDSDNEQNATLLFKSARNSSTNHSSLAVAVVEGQAGVAKAFRIGANLVLTKPINVEQSKGTLRVARGLLRKGAEAAKSAPVPGTPVPPSRPVESTLSPKPTFVPASVPKPQPPTEISAPAASQLEVEKEPEAHPEPAEVAFLESMSDVPTHNAPVGGKEFPWQPVAKPLAEPMASAMRRAAEAAGKETQAEAEAGRQKPASPAAAASREMDTRSFGRDAGAAAAPAPAKEKVTHVVLPAADPIKADEDHAFAATAIGSAEPAIEAPSFSSLDDETQQGSGGSKKTLTVVAAIILLVAACAYFGWTKLHLGNMLSSGEPQPSVSMKPAASAPLPAPAPGSTVVTATPASPAPAGTTPESAAGNTASKPSAAIAKEEDITAAASAKPAPAVKSPEPFIVKTETPKAAQPKPPVEEAVAPPELGPMDSGSSSQAISGLVTSTPVNVPQQPPQMVKVSQGVSQGLLLKRVQPVYPAQAMQIRIQGAVQLQAVISKEGNITNVKVLSGDSILARAAVEAVRQWKYKPYYLNGDPVEIQTQITVNFKLP